LARSWAAQAVLQQKKRPKPAIFLPDPWIINSDLPQKQRFCRASGSNLHNSKMASGFWFWREFYSVVPLISETPAFDAVLAI